MILKIKTVKVVIPTTIYLFTTIQSVDRLYLTNLSLAYKPKLNLGSDDSL